MDTNNVSPKKQSQRKPPTTGAGNEARTSFQRRNEMFFSFLALVENLFYSSGKIRLPFS